MRARFLPFALLSLTGLLHADTRELSPTEVTDVITRFAAKEAEFARARASYLYRQSVKLQEADDNGTPGGKFEEVSEVGFTNDGKRTERVVRAPGNTLEKISMTAEDLEDLRSVQPFVLTSKNIEEYYVRYLGRQKADEIPCYVFAVKPKTLQPGKRYFSGEIWVDDKDLQIVKTYGRATGYQKKGRNQQQFAKFETYREQIDGKYWFPTYTTANDTLVFAEGPPVRLKMTVKYEDYKQFKSDVKITFGDEVDQPTPAPAPKKP